MVKHIVAWKLKETAHGISKQENAQKIKSLLENLNGKIPGLLKLEVGFDFSATAESSDIVLYSEFVDHKALDEYQIHPLHMKVKEFLPLVRSERRVVDYEV